MTRERLEKLEKYFLYFVLYSVIGWLYEVFLEVVVYRWGFSNRGVLFGPYCVIYGTGALILIFALGPLKRRNIRAAGVPITPILMFLGIVVLTTALELAASYAMEFFLGGWQWDYRRFAFNFQGRIALNPSIRFGIGGMVFLYLLQPLFEKMTGRMKPQTLHRVSSILALVLLTDVVFTLLSRLF
jgi:uncharacterized membrane protein